MEIQVKVFYLNEILNNYQFKGNVKDGYNSGVIEEVKVALNVEGITYVGSEECCFFKSIPKFQQ